MSETYPCCQHCQFPGCPEWNKAHEVRCWRCLSSLCNTHRDNGVIHLFVKDAVTNLRFLIIEVDKGV
jgi:hypothetical protein